jgi:hypothetical protein
VSGRRLKQSLPDCAHDLWLLTEAINDANAWCAPRVDLSEVRKCLRSADLAPRNLALDPWTVVRRLLSTRSSLLQKRSESSPPPNGRLLVYFPEQNLFDGAAEQETNGFFDDDNQPPWDTWIGFFEDEGRDPSLSTYLVAWIPSPFVSLAARGIDVNPEQCIAWLDQTKTALAMSLPEVPRGGSPTG